MGLIFCMCGDRQDTASPRLEGADREEKRWHAMRATYGRALKARDFLQGKGIHTFVPMRYCKERLGTRNIRRLVPVMPNIIFVYSGGTELKEAKRRADYIQYMTNHRTGEKIIVGDKDMERFIAVCGTLDEHLLWLHEESADLEKGSRVRVTGGMFKGQEGMLLKVKGARDKRVVVAIKGVMAVALASIPRTLIKEI